MLPAIEVLPCEQARSKLGRDRPLLDQKLKHRTPPATVLEPRRAAVGDNPTMDILRMSRAPWGEFPDTLILADGQGNVVSHASASGRERMARPWITHSETFNKAANS